MNATGAHTTVDTSHRSRYRDGCCSTRVIPVTATYSVGKQSNEHVSRIPEESIRGPAEGRETYIYIYIYIYHGVAVGGINADCRHIVVSVKAVVKLSCSSFLRERGTVADFPMRQLVRNEVAQKTDGCTHIYIYIYIYIWSNTVVFNWQYSIVRAHLLHPSSASDGRPTVLRVIH